MKPLIKKTVATLLLSSFAGGQVWATSLNDILYNCEIYPEIATTKPLQINYSLDNLSTDYLKVANNTFDEKSLFTMLFLKANKNLLGGLISSDWLIMTLKNTRCVGSEGTGTTITANSFVHAETCGTSGPSVLTITAHNDGTYTIKSSIDKTLFLTANDAQNVNDPGEYKLQWKQWATLGFNRHQKWRISCVDMGGSPQSPPNTAKEL